MSNVFRILRSRHDTPIYNIEELIEDTWYLRAWGFKDCAKVFAVCRSLERGEYLE